MPAFRCAVRKISLEVTPEELVRQDLLNRMIEHLGYPPGLLVVEKELSQLPHLAGHSGPLPQRRADILCFGKGIHPQYELYPLLLIECKSVALNSKVINQVVGYNHYVRAPFIALANQKEFLMGWFNLSLGKYEYTSYLPRYQDLMKSCS